MQQRAHGVLNWFRGLHNGHACDHDNDAADDRAAEDLAQPHALHRAHEGDNEQLCYLQHSGSQSSQPASDDACYDMASQGLPECCTTQAIREKAEWGSFMPRLVGGICVLQQLELEWVLAW